MMGIMQTFTSCYTATRRDRTALQRDFIKSSYGPTPADADAAGAAVTAAPPRRHHSRYKNVEFTWASEEDRKAVAKAAGGRSLWKMEDDTKPKKTKKSNRWGGRRVSSEEDE